MTLFGTSPHEKLSMCFPDCRPFEEFDNPDPNASEQWRKRNAHESSVTTPCSLNQWNALHDRVTNFNVPHPTFCQIITFVKQFQVVTKQLLQEGSEMWDLSHSINIVIFRPMAFV